MPYFIWDESPECSGWAVVKADGEQIACHSNKQEAIENMVALSVIEGIEPGGSYDDSDDEEELDIAEIRDVCEDCDGACEVCKEVREVNLTPPAYMRAAARQGLRYYEQGLAGDGLVERTVREARAMAAGNVTADKWVRIAAWIARHLGDLDSAAA